MTDVAVTEAAAPEAPAKPAAVRKPRPQPGRQAVVIIHGMGEQRPMDTVRDFVKTTWGGDVVLKARDVAGSQVWNKPDTRTGSLELRRITTRKSQPGGAYPAGVRTDFYELYWADLTGGSTWQQFVGWVRYLLFRRWSNVPTDVRSAWLALWALSIVAVLFAVASVLPKDIWGSFAPSWLPQWPFILVAGGLGSQIHRVATATFGRVVRYTRADPDNIAARAAVRERGLALFKALHDSGDYDRIIVVGHSLGTILAFDLVSYFWAQREAVGRIDEGTDEFAALIAVDRAAAALRAKPDADTLSAYRAAQARLRRLLSKRPPGTDVAKDGRWLISDLVTIGSPLTHAEFLLAASADDLAARQNEREVPTSPPYRETLDGKALHQGKQSGLVDGAASDCDLFAFPVKGAQQSWQLHHAAPFAVVRWTNIFDPAQAIHRGDLISGPLAENFGPGIRDIDLRGIRGQSKRFSHTRYWASDAPERQLSELRDALNFLDR
ncbi:MAG: hypothetical protein HYX38_33330 [Rhodospirillales bacterium]|nr:hypothetical protein [Rhodospirillales bacterium]